MLKNVVLPAPLGPMIETIERSGTSNDDVVDGDQAAELLGDVVGDQQRRATAGASRGWRSVPRSLTRFLVELQSSLCASMSPR